MSLALASIDVRNSTASAVDERLRVAARGVKSDLPCRTFDPDLWFADSPAELELAKSLCVECPLRAECLAGAIERAEPWGVWGGEIFERGAVVPRKRPRGRPRKEDVARDAVLRVEVAARTKAVTAGVAA
ncbi:WhiB family transcriptional regulator [Dactylosporangium darangshiense]|jgi:WhiB family redox-sensing transcriptional regulator|uniref:Transcriptional regulator WhiB n=1 Tax=Dactylosporangium darangshiense TaxID=579108 RepID=A0ABP8D552_9ACTN|nr:WhiB family transcriptional regulator [Dactylosporangium sp.]